MDLEILYGAGIIYAVVLWMFAFAYIAKRDFIAAAPLAQATSLGVGGVTLLILDFWATWSPKVAPMGWYMPSWLGAVVYGFTLGWLATGIFTFLIVVLGIDINLEAARAKRLQK